MPYGGSVDLSEYITQAGFGEAFTAQVLVVPLTGTLSEVEVIHNKGRKVFPMYFNEDRVLQHPLYEEVDNNTIRVSSTGLLSGSLIII